jgi:pimeloyl-ACP methyl ester carboxylesterase
MPKINAKFQLNYEQQGSGEPLILIPYIAADHACYAFQVAEFAKHFTCISVDLRGTGESENPEGEYSTETLADDVVAFMNALEIEKAHVFGMSLGAGVGLWVAAKYPTRVRSLSMLGGWTKSDNFVRTVLEGWQDTARTSGSVAETVISRIFPWCLTPETYVEKPAFVQSLADFVRSRPAQTVESFIRQSNAALGHDVEKQLSSIGAPTHIMLGQYDMMTSMRFAGRMKREIRNSELHVFEGCSHAALYEKIEEFNQVTMKFLQGRAASRAA